MKEARFFGKCAGLCACVSLCAVLNLTQVACSTGHGTPMRASGTSKCMTAADATVTVNMNTIYQTMDGWGGMDRWNGYRGDNKARASQLTAKNLIADVPFNVMGIGANFYLWEQTNDNSDPLSFNWTAFKNVQLVPEYFGGLKSLGVGTTVLDVGNNPTWWSGASDDEIVVTLHPPATK